MIFHLFPLPPPLKPFPTPRLLSFFFSALFTGFRAGSVVGLMTVKAMGVGVGFGVVFGGSIVVELCFTIDIGDCLELGATDADDLICSMLVKV